MGKHESVLYTQEGLHGAQLLPVMFAMFEFLIALLWVHSENVLGAGGTNSIT